MTRFLAAQLGRSHYYDISRARRDFGYAPVVSTAEGLRRLASDLAGAGRQPR
jgi:nucleoside-diphosphate-sugar epimerase